MALASSSSSSIPRKKHDVFLSFRGEDTRDNFTSHLYTALKRKSVDAYIDNQLIRGEEISRGLLQAIEESELSVIIFSENYASSSWCLDELLHILECKDNHGQVVVPVFYRVDPSCVRKQSGSYGTAIDDLRKRHGADKVAKWKDALTKAANLSGWSTQHPMSESELVEKIVGDIIKKLNNMVAPRVEFEGLVGIRQRIQQIESLLQVGSDDVRVVGIWGMGGIGKTTLAEAIFNKWIHHFEGHCFLEGVREKWERCKEECQVKFYSELLEEREAGGRLTYEKVRLSRKKVLIVLDDVNDEEQLEYFVGDCNNLVGPGSRIIVTSRDKKSFGNRESALYKLEGLDYDEAHQLFCLNAFKRSSLVPYSKELLGRVVKYAEGIPLAIKVLASLFGRTSKEKWGSLLDKQKVCLVEKIQNILRISYDGLDEDQKNIFLDIACFFKGWDRHYVQDILEGCGFYADIGIEDLVDKSLIKINDQNKLCMHDLIQQMGWEVIRLESPKEPGKRSRLWTAQDIYHVLKHNNATAMIEGIFLDTSEMKEVDLSSHVFQEAHNLRLLKISCSHRIKKCRVNLPQDLRCLPDALRYLYWEAYPSKCLPSDFAPENLVELRMPYSQVERLWDKVQDLPKLKILDMAYCEKLTVLPGNISSRCLEVLNLNGCRNIRTVPTIKETIVFLNLSETSIEELPASIGSSHSLEELELDNCKSLESVPSNIFQLESLSHLSLSGCSSLKKIPDLEELKVEGCKSLQTLNLSGCSSLERIPELPRALIQLDLSETTIEEVPSSIELLHNLMFLDLRNCKRLRSLPTGICKLQSLDSLDLSGCSKFDHFPEISEPMKGLSTLFLSKTAINALPSSIENLVSLKSLSLRFCSNLKFIPTSIYKLQRLHKLDLSGYSEHLMSHYSIVGHLANLVSLELSDCDMSKIPYNFLNGLDSIPGLCLSGKRIDTETARISFPSLECLYMRNWKNLRSLPEFPFDVKNLDAQGCTSLETVSSSSTAILQGARHRDVRELFFDDRMLFLNCLNLNQNAKNNIIADAQLIILRKAIYVLSRKTIIREDIWNKYASICYPGNEIPEWYNYQATGSSINIVLPLDWLKNEFLGFSLCFVVEFTEHNYTDLRLSFECEFHLKTGTKEIYKFKHVLNANDRRMVDANKTTIVNSDHVFMMFEPESFAACKAIEGSITEVSFHFCPVYKDFDRRITPADSAKVKRCGIRLLFRQEAEEQKIPLPND